MHAVIVRARVRGCTHLVRQYLPFSGFILEFQRIYGWFTVTGNRLAGRCLVEVETDIINGLRAALEFDDDRILGVFRSLGSPERFHDVRAIHGVGRRISLGLVSGFHICILCHVGLAPGSLVNVLAGLRENLGDAAGGTVGDFVGVRHGGGDGTTDLGTGIILHFNRSACGIVDEMRKPVGGEHRTSVKVQGISLRNVVRSVVVPDD